MAAEDGVSVAYTVQGQGAPHLVFIHGWMCNQGYWSEQVDTFKDRHRVVTLDLAGHGASGSDRSEWTIAAFGADVKAVVEHLGLDRVILVGHSLGGPVALEAARLLPGRVVGVIGVDTLLDADFEWPEEQKTAFFADLQSDFPATCRTFVGSMFPQDADGELLSRIATDMCSGPADVGTAIMLQFPSYDMRTALSAAGVPIRCINAGMWPTNVEGNRRFAPDYDAVITGRGRSLPLSRGS